MRKSEDKQIHQKGRQDASAWASEMKEETLLFVERATSKNFKIMNTQFLKKAGRRWTCRSPDGHTKNEIDYIMTDKPSMVTDVTVINRINIGSDHRMVMGSITLNTRAEGRKLLNKNTRTRVDTEMIGTKKNTFQLELKNRFTALEEHDDMDSLNKNMTEMIQQSAMSIAKQIKKQKSRKYHRLQELWWRSVEKW